MAENEIPIKLEVETNAALKDLAKFEKQTLSSVQGIEKAFTALKFVAGAAIAAFAGKQIFNALSSAVEAAAEADKAVAQLNVSLASTGEFSKEASSELQKFAGALQRTTTVSDDAAIQALALAKSFGISNDQAKNLVQSAVNLSAATGKDLNTAVEQLGATYSGTAGRLSKLGPEFKKLTEEQLKNGEAIALVQKRFGGFAEELTKTFSGAVAQAGNNFDDIFENIGKVITQNPVVIAVINAASKAFAEFAKFIENNQVALQRFVGEGIKSLLGVLPTVINLFLILKTAIESIDFIAIAKAVAILAASFAIFRTGAIISSIATITTTLFSLAKAAALASVALAPIALKFIAIGGAVAATAVAIDIIQAKIRGTETVTSQLVDMFKSLPDTFSKQLKENGATLDIFNLEATKSVKTGNEFIDNILKQVNSINKLDASQKISNKTLKNGEKATRDLANAESERLKGSFDKLKQGYEEITKELDKQTKTARELILAESDRADELASNAEKELKQLGKLDAESQKLIKAYRDAAKAKRDLALTNLSFADLTVKEFGQTVNEGINNFPATVKSAADNFIKSLSKITLGDIGAAISTSLQTGANLLKGVLSGDFIKQGLDIFQNIAQLPKQLLEVFKNADKIFTEILQALPAIIDEIVGKLPQIAENIATSLNVIFETLARRLPDIVGAIVKSLDPLLRSIFNIVIPTIIKALPGLIKQILDALPGLIEIVLKALPGIITEIAKAIPQIVRALADALPGIIEVLADNADEIALALAEGLITASGEIVAALVDSLLVNGGLERIVKALIIATPRVGIALAQGFVRGLTSFYIAIGQAIGRAFVGGVGNFGSKLGLDFNAAVLPSFDLAFLSGGQSLFNSISLAFQNVFVQFPIVIYNAFVQVFAGLTATITQAFLGIFELLKTTIGDGFRSIFGGLIDSIREGGVKLREEFEKPVNSLKEFLSNFKFPEIKSPFGSGSSSGVSIPLPGGGKIGFGATGGQIPAGFPNDTFPARLTSGELVIPAGDTARLSQFLDAQGSEESSDSSLLLANLLSQILAAVQEPQQVNTQIVINGRELANTILELQRNNSRLSA